jgi:hypothetical protein
LEVRELVGPENFDSSNPKYTMPFFWRSDAVPATRSWFGFIFVLSVYLISSTSGPLWCVPLSAHSA